jgi:hypothetical protein
MIQAIKFSTEEKASVSKRDPEGGVSIIAWHTILAEYILQGGCTPFL